MRYIQTNQVCVVIAQIAVVSRLMQAVGSLVLRIAIALLCFSDMHVLVIGRRSLAIVVLRL